MNAFSVYLHKVFCMKLAITAFFISFSSLLVAQPLSLTIKFANRTALPGSDTIYFSSRLPQWPDFVGTPKTDGIVAAMTSSGFGFDAGMHSRNNKGVLTIGVYSFFNRSKSWVKPDKKTAYILNHEQLHFAISHIGALIFAQQLKQARFTLSNYNQLLTDIYTASYKQMSDMQNRYDSETRNGMLKDKQAEWNVRITTTLSSLQQTLR